MTTQPPPVAPGTVQVWSDLLCPFAHLALHRLRQARERLGLPGPHVAGHQQAGPEHHRLAATASLHS